MESASPEPSRPLRPTPTTGTAAQGPTARSEPAGGGHQGAGERSEPAGGGHVVRVVDAQDEPIDPARLERLARHVLVTLEVPTELELAITCVDSARISELNEEHLAGTGATDVLAFPIDGIADVTAGVPGLLGDVVVCPRVAFDQAGRHGRTPPGEIDLLVVHGILHLLGHDHGTEDERTRMFGLTDALLAGVADDTSRP